MGGTMTKQDILKALDDLPEDATIEDAMERLYFMYQVEKGLKQIAEGRTGTQKEATAQLVAGMDMRLVSGVWTR